MLVGSVQIISRLDSQRKFQMFALFSAAILVEHGAPPTWRLHTGLCIIICTKHFDEYSKFGTTQRPKT